MPREPRREERVCKIAEGGRAPASGSDQGRGVQNSQLLPPSLRVGKTELSLQLFPSPSPQDPHLCPVSPTQGCEARSDLLGASPGSLQLLLFPGSRPRAGVRGGCGGTRVCKNRDAGFSIWDHQSPRWAAAGPAWAPVLTWPARRPRHSAAGAPGSLLKLPDRGSQSLRPPGWCCHLGQADGRRVCPEHCSQFGVGGGGGFLVTLGSGAIKAPLM